LIRGRLSISAEIAQQTQFAESTVEEAALQWFGELGFAIKHGPHIAPGELHAERTGFGETILAKRLRDALAGLSLQESRTLSPLRDALLPKLLSGEVRVRSSLGDRGL